jgi:hypothetical protein
VDNVPVNSAMTKSEREELCKLIRRREKIEKTATEQRSAELLADFERQLASIYKWDQQETWRAAKEAADQAVAEANALIATRCRELGIPKEFAPCLSMHWHGRGENGWQDRRAELRRVAQTRIAAMERAAWTQIEKRSVELQEQAVVGALQSDAAQSFLAKLPTVESLMPAIPALELFKLEESLDRQKRLERSRYDA